MSRPLERGSQVLTWAAGVSQDLTITSAESAELSAGSSRMEAF